MRKDRSCQSERHMPPKGAGFSAWLSRVQHDFILFSRADGTWRAYKAWLGVYFAWLEVWGVQGDLSAQVYDQWIEVLAAAVACLAMCYSMGTISIFVSAVSAYMQDMGFASPFSVRYFRMLVA